MKAILITTAVFGLMILAACHKHDIQTISTYSFANGMNTGVTLDIYGNKEDYSNNTNLIGRYFIEPGRSASVALKAPQAYWIDWYTANYSYNNWGPDTIGAKNSFYSNILPRPKIDIATEPDNITIRSPKKDTAMSLLLNGSGTSSTWQVAVAGVPELNGTHTFQFKKDFSVLYSFKPVTGESIVQSLKYTVQNFQSGFATQTVAVTVFDINKAELASFSFYVDDHAVSSFGRDSLATYFDQSGSTDYYWAKRQ